MLNAGVGNQDGNRLARVQHHIGSQYAGNGAAGPDHRHRAGGVEGCLAESGRHATKEVKQHKAEFPQRVFNIIAEDPQIEHVAAQVHQASV